MALIHTVPTTKVVKPSAASTFENGSPPAHLLRDVGDGYGPMLVLPSLGRQAMGIAAYAEGIYLKSSGRGRTLAQQYNLLHARYRMSPPTDRDRNYVQGHLWGGQWWPSGTWYNYRDAMVANPGTSNHGWYCADDIAEELDGDPGAEGLSDRGLIWLRDNAQSFGFGLETHVERWHWHWISGDTLPQRARDVLTFCGVPIPGEQPPVVVQPEPTPEQPPVIVVPEPTPVPPTPTPVDPLAELVQYADARLSENPPGMPDHSWNGSADLREGMPRNREVYLLQRVLINFANADSRISHPGNADGLWGAKTNASFFQLQAYYLSARGSGDPDAIYGPRSHLALQSLSNDLHKLGGG